MDHYARLLFHHGVVHHEILENKLHCRGLNVANYYGGYQDFKPVL
jgi:hypothetical protein